MSIKFSQDQREDEVTRILKQRSNNSKILPYISLSKYKRKYDKTGNKDKNNSFSAGNNGKSTPNLNLNKSLNPNYQEDFKDGPDTQQSYAITGKTKSAIQNNINSLLSGHGKIPVSSPQEFYLLKSELLKKLSSSEIS